MKTADFETARDVVRLTPGRARLSVGRIAERLTDDERTQLGRFVEAAIQAADEAVFLTRKRRLRRQSVYGRAAKEADTANDAALRAVADALDGANRTFPDDGEPIGDAARRLAAALFPRGAGAIITASYPSAVAQTLSLLAESASLADDIAVIPGLTSWFRILRDRAAAFDAALKAEAARAVEPQEVRDAARRCEQRLHELTCAVQVELAGDDPDVVVRRSELLEPYFLQVGEIRRRYQRQLGASEVDPETGEVLGEERLPAEAESANEDVTVTGGLDVADREMG